MAFEHTITDLPRENEYPKLVRDRIPEIVKTHDGYEPPVRVLSDDQEFLKYLQRKAVEEAEELSHATTDSNLAEEIADVYEIIDAIMALKGFSAADIAKTQAEKRAKRGGFDGRLLMLGNKKSN